MGLLSRRAFLASVGSATGGGMVTRLMGGDDEHANGCPTDDTLSVEQARTKADLLAHLLRKHCLAIEFIEVTVVALEDDFLVWVEFSTEELSDEETHSVFTTTVKVFTWFAADHDAFTEAYFSHDVERRLYANYTVKRAWTQLPTDVVLRKARTTYKKAG